MTNIDALGHAAGLEVLWVTNTRFSGAYSTAFGDTRHLLASLRYYVELVACQMPRRQTPQQPDGEAQYLHEKLTKSL
jgi:hypothetical protein